MATLGGWVHDPKRQIDCNDFADALRRSISPTGTADVLEGDGWHLSADRRRVGVRVTRAGRWAVLIAGSSKTLASEGGNLVGEFVAEYERAGAGVALSKLRGGYAIAMVALESSEAVLATDRFGIGSLYFAYSDAGMAFASEVLPLRSNPFSVTTTRSQSIFDYLYFGMIPGPDTIYREVYRLEPGHILEFNSGRVQSGAHRPNPPFSGRERTPSAAELLDCVRSGVADSIADGEEVGCFLSGGLDSSTVTGFAGEVTGMPPRAYSIGFDAEGFDEMEYARTAARHFGAKHSEYYVTPKDVVDLLPKLAGVYGMPFGNSSVVPTYYCAKLAREDGIDKLLAGDGGDELFGGNTRYATQLAYAKYDALPASVRRLVIEPLVDVVPDKAWFWPIHKVRRYVDQARVQMPDRLETYNFLHMLGIRTVLEPQFLESVDVCSPRVQQREYYESIDACGMLDKILELDIKYTLADNDLQKVTRMCALASVEVAYPLLTEELHQLARRLPGREKTTLLRLRPYFRRSLRGFLPDETLKKSKHGFGLPVGDWLVSDKPFGGMARDLLTDLKGRGVVRADFLDDLIGTKLQDHPKYYGGLVWLFMVLELWMRETSHDAHIS